VQGFRDRGKEVVEVDRAPFRAAVVEPTWGRTRLGPGHYDRLQGIQ
jgi:hypothetical protein